MKTRLVKKWLKRYVYPYIDGLPQVNSSYAEATDGYTVHVYNENHSIKQGFDIPEGNVVPYGGSIRKQIIRSGDAVKKILSDREHVFLRVPPRVAHGRVYMRLITEKVN